MKIKVYLKNTLPDKQINFIINFITRIIKLKRFFSIYKVGENDNYPEIPHCKKSFLRNLLFIDKKN